MFGQQDSNSSATGAAGAPAVPGISASDLNGLQTGTNGRLTPKADTAAAAPEDPTQAQDVPSSAPMLPDANGDELLGIKQQALQQLTPLLDHLEQSPEERFRTVMMLIQASDNPALITMAYDAASHMSDDKQRAEALLDIVNEINYFTQRQQTDQ